MDDNLAGAVAAVAIMAADAVLIAVAYDSGPLPPVTNHFFCDVLCWRDLEH